MSDENHLGTLKLCLEALTYKGLQPELIQLDKFLSQAQTQVLVDDFCQQLKQAFEASLINESELLQEQQDDESVDNNTHSTELSTDLSTTNPIEPETEAEPSSETTETDEPTELSDEVVTENTVCDDSQSDIPLTNPQSKELEMKPLMPPVRFKLPNATVNKSYSATLEIIGNKMTHISTMEGLDGLGLAYDAESNLLEGQPQLAGEHKLIIHYQLDGNDYTGQINLVINNDPKALWKNIPSDKQQKYWKEDEDCQGIEGLYQWKLIAASKRGRSHAHVGSCRDDDFALKVDEQGQWHIAAVADGAGSSEYSREGSKVIVHNSSEVLSEQLQQHDAHLMALLTDWQQDNSLDTEQALIEGLYEVFAPAIISSIEKLETLADNDERNFKDYYSTLLLTAHKPLANGSFTIAYWIGDGGLGIYNAGKEIKLLGAGDSGDYAGQTRFLDISAKSPDDIKARLRFSFDKSFTSLVLMSDGISDPLFETDNNLKQLEFWDVFWSNDIQPQLTDTPETSAEQLKDWLDFWSPGNHDDRTLALIYP